jgi:arylesterase / paraoxonase
MPIWQVCNSIKLMLLREILMKKSTIGVLVSVGLVGLASYMWFRTSARAGEFTTLVPVFEGTCRDVGGIPGAEDIAIDRSSGTLFISSDDRRAFGKGSPVRGSIKILPLAGLESNPARIDATGGKPERFQPHGLSLFQGSDGKTTLMVVNHPNGPSNHVGTSVEIYDVSPKQELIWRRSVSVAGLTRINDIAATGPDSFYATSESDLRQGTLSEAWGTLVANDRTGAIWHFDGSKGKKLQSGLGFANSLALSPDGRTLYASGTQSRAIFIYDRNPPTNALVRRDAALIATGVDNLDVEPDGRVWIAAHPRLLTFIRHARDPGEGAPSQVIVLEPSPTGKGGKVDQVYLKEKDDGFSGASVAIRVGQTMVMGSVFEPGIRVCTLPGVWKQSESHPAQRLLDTERDVLKEEAEKAKTSR